MVRVQQGAHLRAMYHAVQRKSRTRISELKSLPSEALYHAVGRTPLDGLNWCIKEGIIRNLQVIGRLAHPSPRSGSAVPSFIEEVSREEMDPNDPVFAPVRRSGYGS